MSENGNLEESQTSTSSENVEEEIPGFHNLIQEVVNEQIKGFIALSTRQLEEMARLVQGMVMTPHPIKNPRTDHISFPGTATRQSDNGKGSKIVPF